MHIFDTLCEQLVKAGMSREEAEKEAARVYNAGRTPGQAPVEAIDSSGLSVPRMDEKGPSLRGW